jgi:hypothetical protein
MKKDKQLNSKINVLTLPVTTLSVVFSCPMSSYIKIHSCTGIICQFFCGYDTGAVLVEMRNLIGEVFYHDLGEVVFYQPRSVYTPQSKNFRK